MRELITLRSPKEENTMSIFGAMGTAISGLNAQSAALGNISDDIANSQTTGYKRVDTTFADYITTSTANENGSGSVVAQPDYVNTVQGSITQTDNPLALAISGQGFFAVSATNGNASSTGQPIFDSQQYYTRDGNFQLDKNGYLINNNGDYLNGWPASSSGTIDTTTLAPIQIAEQAYAPVATSTISLAANLPPAGKADATNSTVQDPITTSATIYDAQGTSHQLTLSFLSQGADSNNWKVTVTDDSGNTVGQAQVTFAADGTLATLSQATGTQSAAGSAAAINLATTYPASGGGTQDVTLDIGTIGGSTGLTQHAGSSYTLGGLTQNGVPPGQFNSITMSTNGNVVANYDNGQSRVVAQVPVITFPAPDALQRQDGASFTATLGSGQALAQVAGTSGAGSLATNALEQSNVDIATEFSNLIVAQQAYAANAKTVTTANAMTNTTINMIQ
jgi:flagellar hook protein FlgE